MSIGLLINSCCPNEDWINQALDSAEGFDEILLYVDFCDNKAKNIRLDKVHCPLKIFVSADHKGITEGYEFLVNNSSTEWVCLFGDDDYFHKENLNKAITFVSNSTFRADVINFKCFQVKDDDASEIFGAEKFNMSELLLENLIPCSSFIRKDVLQTFGFGGKVAQDWSLWLKVMDKGYQFCYFPLPVYYHRVRENSSHRKVCAKYALTDEMVRSLVWKEVFDK